MNPLRKAHIASLFAGVFLCGAAVASSSGSPPTYVELLQMARVPEGYARQSISDPAQWSPTTSMPWRLQHGDRLIYGGVIEKARSVQGLPLWHGLKNYWKLSKKEFALLCNAVPVLEMKESGARGALEKRMQMYPYVYRERLEVFPVSWLVDEMHERGVSFIAGWEDYAHLLAAREEEVRKAAAGCLTEGMAGLRIGLGPLKQYMSPVSGGIIEPWHSEWSAGNAYIVEITEPEALASLRNTWWERMEWVRTLRDGPRGYSDDPYYYLKAFEIERARFYYFRVYGEEEGTLIAEGLREYVPKKKLTEEEVARTRGIIKARNDWRTLARDSRYLHRLFSLEVNEDGCAKWLTEGEVRFYHDTHFRAGSTDYERFRELQASYEPNKVREATGETYREFEARSYRPCRLGWEVARTLGTVEGLPLDDPLKPYSELSREERLLLSGCNRNESLRLWQRLIQYMASHDVKRIRDARDLVPYLLSEGDPWLTESVSDVDFCRGELMRFASPITGRLFEPWHEELSPGNGFITQVTDEGDVELLKGLLAADPRRDEPESRTIKYGDVEIQIVLDVESAKFYYFRLHGEDAIIGEGIYLVAPRTKETWEAIRAAWEAQGMEKKQEQSERWQEHCYRLLLERLLGSG